MTLEFMGKITKEGKRRVINVPVKYIKNAESGKKVLVSELDLDKMTKEQMRELLEK